ncbi:MAG: hypothetical protein N2Z20_00700 [Elusimicrobiales bacterium]|nr:hypothetical protein [Elusimicrobiales bacterium]
MEKEIIILEDDEELGVILHSLLKAKGYKSYVFTNFFDFEKFIKENKTKEIIIFADIIIGTTNIINDLLKLQNELHHSKIIFVTAHLKHASQVRELGYKCIIKPYDASEFLSYI